MNWVNTALVLIPTGLLFVQGISCIKNPVAPVYVRWFGGLCILLSVLGLPLYTLLSSGALVLSPEFGILMVEGHISRFCLGLLIVGIAIGAGMSWHVVRSLAKRPSRASWLLSIGSIVGVFAANRLLPLSDYGSEPLLIYAYDLWWPPLLVWLSVCFVESAVAVAGVRASSARGSLITFVLTVLAAYALSQPALADSWSHHIWLGCLWIMLPATIVLTASLVVEMFGTDRGDIYRWAALTATTVIGVLSEWILHMQGRRAEFFASEWTAAAVIAFAYLHYRRFLKQAENTVQLTPPKPKHTRNILLLALVALGVGFASLFYFENNSGIALIFIICGWILLAEGVVTAGSSESLLRRIWVTGKSYLRSIHPIVRSAADRITNGGKRAGAMIKGLVSASSLPDALIKTVVFAVVLIGILVAVREIPNAGGTIIEPFKPFSQGEGEDLGPAASNYLLSSLGQLKKDLEPDVIIPSGPAADPSFKFVSAGGSAYAALAINSNLEFSNMEIPLGVLIYPVETLARRLLGVRVIDGAVYSDNDSYAILANSNTGEVWSARSSDQQLSDRQPSEQACAEETVDTSFAPTANEELGELTDELAFKISSIVPDLGDAGLTSSWEAFQHFRIGLTAWQHFRSTQNYNDLSCAIDHFREATRSDPRFALAHYRLGLALQKDGQPTAAIDSLRKSLEANPRFIAGRIALATTLFDFDDYYYTTAAAYQPAAASTTRSRQEVQWGEARELWKQVITDPRASVLDRASSYYGLCRETYLSNQPNSAAYYYCKRATRLYAKLPQTQRVDLGIEAVEGSVLDTQGSVLSTLGLMLEKPPDDKYKKLPRANSGWHCSAKTIVADPGPYGAIKSREIPRSPYLHQALHYYKLAKRAAPDDPRIRCNAASTAYALGNYKPMERLKRDPAVRLSLAGKFSEKAQEFTFEHDLTHAAPYYRLALQEYEKSVALKPSNIAALDGYAYTFWAWRLNWPAAVKAPKGPDFDMARKAEAYARSAARLATNMATPNTEITAHSTLGEVLLSQGRTAEAIEQLQEAFNLAPHHPFFEETRWALAAAYLCAPASSHEPVLAKSETQAPEKDPAEPQLKMVLNDEQTREIQFFTDNPRLLNPNWDPFDCQHDHIPKNAHAQNVHDPENHPVSRLWLHIWGDGIDRWTYAGKNSCDEISRIHKSQDEDDEYFAQRYDAKSAKPASKIFSIETLTEKLNHQCSEESTRSHFAAFGGVSHASGDSGSRDNERR